MRGADVLEAVAAVSDADPAFASWARTADVVARLTGSRDGRKITQKLAMLELHGLVERTRVGRELRVRPTARGRHVDAEYARSTAARGGTFIPKVQTDTTWQERLALR